MKAGLVAVVLLTACAQQARAADFDAAIHKLVAAHTHGTRDNELGVMDRIALLERGDLVSFCGEVSHPSMVILNSEGFTVRRVAMLDLDPDPDGIHQGHQLLEAWHPSRERWVTIDIDFGVMYDQRAVTLPMGRVTQEPLETPHGDPEWVGGYPLVAEAIALWRDAKFWYDPSLYTDAEEEVMRGRLWSPWPGDFDADFYAASGTS